MTIEDSNRQSLHGRIYQVLYRKYLLHSHISSHYYLILLLYVFTFFFFLWFLGSLDYVIIPLLPQSSTKGGTTKGIAPSPMRNFLNQIISLVVLEVVTYSTSIVEMTI